MARRLFLRHLAAIVMTCSLSPSFAGYDDGARYAFLPSYMQKSIVVIDLYDRARAHDVKLNAAPDSVAASEVLRALVIGHNANKMLTLVDLMTEELTQIGYPLAIEPNVVLVSPIGETAAIYDSAASILQVHALRRKEILLSVSNVETATELTFNPDGSTIYWVDQAQGTLNAVDLWSSRRSLKLTRKAASLSAMTRSVDGTLGFISNADSDQVYVVDLHDLKMLRTAGVGRAPGRPWGTADGQYMLVPNTGSGTLTAISTLSSDSLYTVKTVSNAVSVNPGWIDTVAAVIGDDGSIIFHNIANGAELSREKLPGAPSAGVVTSDSKTLAVAIPDSGEMAFFDMRKRKRLPSILGMPNDIGEISLAISNNLCH